MLKLPKDKLMSSFVEGLSQKLPAFYSGVPNPADSVVRMNSTCLEVVDEVYLTKGKKLFFISLAILLIIIAISSLIYFYIFPPISQEDSTLPYIFMCLVVGSGTIFLTYILFEPIKMELFDFKVRTIRFNRKTRKVYFFSDRGQIKEMFWEDIFFAKLITQDLGGIVHYINGIDPTLINNKYFEILFRIGIDQTELSNVYGYWEFVRSYMEDDVVAELSDLVEYCPSIDEPQTFMLGLQTLIYPGFSTFLMYFPPWWAYCFISAGFRWLGMRVNKELVWPDWVENECTPSEDDPVKIDSSINPKNTWAYFTNGLSRQYDQQRKEINYAAYTKIEEKIQKKYFNTEGIVVDK